MGSGASDPKQDVAWNCRSCRIVRIRHGDEPRAWTDRGEHTFYRKGEVLAGGNLDHARRFGLSEDRIHRKSGHDDERFVAGLEIGGAEQMNGLIDTVREQHLRRMESEKSCDFGFDRRALGIACERVGIQRAQSCQHAR